MSHNEKRPREARASSERVTDEKAEYASESSTLLTAAAELIASGLGTPLPLPEGQKYPPPKDTTGGKNPRPTTDEALAYLDDHDGNVCLRAADGVAGIDCDEYGDKHGCATMRAKVAEWGPLPDTYMSTSRDPETGSGIHWFRIPPGAKLKGVVGRDVEIVQAHHRYAVVAPSVVEGRAYRWFGPDLEECDVPNVDDLPELPREWVNGLKATVRATRRSGAGLEQWSAVAFAHDWVSPRVWRELADTLPGARSAPCAHMADIGDATALYFTMRDNAAYPTMNALLWKAVRFGTGRAEDGCRGGCPGVYRAVLRIVEAYFTEVTPGGRRARGEGGRVSPTPHARSEVTRSLTDAVRKVAVS